MTSDVARTILRIVRPAWTPPAEVRADKPGSARRDPRQRPNNPMGVAAMTLSGGEYAIHGTNKPEPIGKFATGSRYRYHSEGEGSRPELPLLEERAGVVAPERSSQLPVRCSSLTGSTGRPSRSWRIASLRAQAMK